MNYLRQAIYSNIARFSAKMLTTYGHFIMSPSSDYIKILKNFDDCIDLIDSKTIQACIEMYEHTKDRDYLFEAGILLAMMDYNHQKAINDKEEL